MSRLNLLTIFLLCSIAFAQDAVVVELRLTDAITAKTLYEAKVTADKAWDQFNAKLSETYKNAYSGVSFYSGIQFSKDFRFIVPKPSPVVPSWNSYVIPANGTYTEPITNFGTLAH